MIVGVTGVSCQNEIRDIISAFKIAKLVSVGCRLSLGIGLTYDSLKGVYIGRKYPALSDIPSLLHSCGSLGMIHYSSLQLNTLEQQIDFIMEYCRPVGIQLNICNGDLRWLRRKHEHLFLAVSGKRAEDLLPHINVADYLLLDKSGGRGVPFKFNTVAEEYAKIRRASSSIPIGIAGGFSDKNVVSRVKGMKALGEINFDAESRLRSNDYLDIEKVKRYFAGVFTAISDNSH